MRIFLILIPLSLLFTPVAHAQYKMSHAEYIQCYKSLAVQSMEEFRIPASITLAQGILESGCGGGRLAVEGNNHFGIKCKGSWTGETIHHDDDALGECFRKYRTAAASYHDHSKFLTESPRYSALFQLDITDYRGWARGLKAAGYATNPQYPELLIGLIERNNLQAFDQPEHSRAEVREERRQGNHRELLRELFPTQRSALQNNRVEYVISVVGESFSSIAARHGMSIERLLKINDLKGAFPLPEGTALYIQTKKTRAADTATHTIQSGESYHSVAQQYGIKLKSLQHMNPIARKTPPQVGQVLRLQ